MKNFNIFHVSTGDVLRHHIDDKTPLGLEAQNYINSGKLIPDEQMVKCIVEELKKLEGKSILLDGFPRTKIQAQKLWDIQKIDSVISLIVPYEIIIGETKFLQTKSL